MYAYSFNTREEMIRELVPQEGVYAEIGVFVGKFAESLKNILNPKQLVLIDLFEGEQISGDQDGNNVVQCNLDESFVRIKNRYASDATVEVRKGDSVSVLSEYPDNHFDMIYIDGDHSYAGCKRDLEVAFKKVKSDGWICGHDYTMNMEKANTFYNFGVARAVDEFCNERKLSIHALGMDGCVSFAIRKYSKRHLVYYTHGYSDDYNTAIKLSIHTLQTTTLPAPIDIAVLCDTKMASEIRQIQGVYVFEMPDSPTPEAASINKLKVFDTIPNISEYESVLFIDSDILAYSNVMDILQNLTRDDVLYVPTESKDMKYHQVAYWSQGDYTADELAMFEREGVHIFNCGCFGFRPSKHIRQHFSNILDTVRTHTGNFFYEQSYMNTYFNRILGSTDRNVIVCDRNYIMFPTSGVEYPNTLIHFCGNAGNGKEKGYYMTDYHYHVHLKQPRFTDDYIVQMVRPFTMTSEERIRNVLKCVEAVIKNNIAGDFIEIGVWRGGIIMAMAMKCIQMGDTSRTIHAYDTFEGMTTPSHDDVDHNGKRAEDILESVLCRSTFEETKKAIDLVNYPHVQYHKGDIMKANLSEIPDNIAILRLDTDWYELTKFEIEHFVPKVSAYGFVIIDDYGHWQGCHKAVDEYLHTHTHITPIPIDYTGIYWPVTPPNPQMPQKCSTHPTQDP